MVNPANSNKIIYLDIDGTITRQDGTVPDSAVRAIRLAMAKGNLCVVNTGRPYSHIVDSVRDMHLNGYICSCGQTVLLNGRIVKRELMSPADCAAIIRKARECRSDLFLESENGLFYSYVHPIPAHSQEEFQRFRDRGFDVDASVDTTDFTFDKLCCWEQEDTDMDSFLQFISPWFFPIRHEGPMRELVRNGCSKATGMQIFTELTGLKGAETYAIGDSGNDELMLKAVDHSIAMGHAPQWLRDICEYTTGMLEEDGILQAFEHYSLI